MVMRPFTNDLWILGTRESHVVARAVRAHRLAERKVFHFGKGAALLHWRPERTGTNLAFFLFLFHFVYVKTIETKNWTAGRNVSLHKAAWHDR
jgi:hypothetical protein